DHQKRAGLMLQQIPSNYMGTGLAEWIEYLVPTTYDPQDPPVPLLVCWHSYGQSCQSVAYESLLDEECESRNWIFLAITGAQQCNFGYLDAQIHCTKAIEYLIQVLGLKIDTNRIYMAGLSMGGSAAASYASRHLCELEGYRVAGLILVASSFDLVHAYYQNDPGVQYWLPILLGGPPTSHTFQYRQIGDLTIISGDTYRLDRSMGQNLNNHMPIFLTYAGNDPLTYGPYQNEIFINMLTDIGANLQVDYKPTDPNPHKWLLLDVETACDFIEPYSLEDQEDQIIQVLADRDAQYYWARVVKDDPDSFAGVLGAVSVPQNRVAITDTTNVNSFTVDCDWAGLDGSATLRLEYNSIDATTQDILIRPIPAEPTYVVNGTGTLYLDYSYFTAQEMIAVNWSGAAPLDIKCSFEPYLLNLSSPSYAQLAQQVFIQMSNGDAYDPYLFMFAVVQTETKVGIHNILVNPLPPTLWLFSALDVAGESSFTISVPNDGSLLGVKIYQQFLTYNTQVKEISNLASTTIQM
ncbi:MAG: alpha/beta hydrolase, partial [Planctomycetota bacterium]